jgi:hypothetical protein
MAVLISNVWGFLRAAEESEKFKQSPPHAITRAFERRLERTRCLMVGCRCWASAFHGHLCQKHHASGWKLPVEFIGSRALGELKQTEPPKRTLQQTLDPCLFKPFAGVSSYQQMRRFEIALTTPERYLVVNMNAGSGRRLGAFVDSPADVQHWFVIGLLSLQTQQDWYVVDAHDSSEMFVLVSIMADLPTARDFGAPDNKWWAFHYLPAMEVLGRRVGDDRDEAK